MISVIVPVYNVQRYLDKCVNSILNQTYKDLEIILVDDGSTDDSPKICDRYVQIDKRVKVIHQNNAGLSCARNAGINIATGDYIGFVDSDDYIENTMYEMLYNSIKKYDADISMCNCTLVDESEKQISVDNFDDKIFSNEEVIKNVILPLKTAAWNKLYRRKIIASNRFPCGLIHGEDLVFITSIFNKSIRVSATNQTTYYYVKHSNSITSSKFSEKSFDEVKCKDISYNNIVPKFPEYENDFLVWKYRARMNLFRQIHLVNQIDVFDKEISEYFLFIETNHKLVRKRLSVNENIEYVLISFSKSLYSKILNVLYR